MLRYCCRGSCVQDFCRINTIIWKRNSGGRLAEIAEIAVAAKSACRSWNVLFICTECSIVCISGYLSVDRLQEGKKYRKRQEK